MLCVLYRAFDATGGLLYVGATTNPASRLNDHHMQKPWRSEVSNVTLEHFDTVENLHSAETHAIKSEAPRYNHLHIRSTRPRGTPRGAMGDGSLYQRASDGLWVGAYVVIDATGRRKRRVVASKDRHEAQRKLDQLKANAEKCSDA